MVSFRWPYIIPRQGRCVPVYRCLDWPYVVAAGMFPGIPFTRFTVFTKLLNFFIFLCFLLISLDFVFLKKNDELREQTAISLINTRVFAFTGLFIQRALDAFIHKFLSIVKGYALSFNIRNRQKLFTG